MLLLQNSFMLIFYFLIQPFKEKATNRLEIFNEICIITINYHLFSRASGDVVISNSGDFLFLKETVLSEGKNSSYSHISTEEKKQLIQNLNTAYDFYKKEGFTEVFLSIIPSTATMIQPENYNNLIPIIQNAPDLKMKIIDIYSHFLPNPRLYYLKGDTHWNEKGVKTWVDLVNNSVLL